MIDDSVIELFKASLTHLMTSKQQATGFQMSAMIKSEKGKVSVFIVKDDQVAKQFFAYLDALAKDYGGRQATELRIKGVVEPPEENN